jgi:hypothetical protein
MSTEKNARECFVQEKERDGEEAVKGLTGLARKYYSSNILDIYFFFIPSFVIRKPCSCILLSPPLLYV